MRDAAPRLHQFRMWQPIRVVDAIDYAANNSVGLIATGNRTVASSLRLPQALSGLPPFCVLYTNTQSPFGEDPRDQIGFRRLPVPRLRQPGTDRSRLFDGSLRK